MYLPAQAVISSLIYVELLYVTLASIIDSGGQAPLFLQEPLSRLEFSNDTGSQISCSAHGSPTPRVTWVQKDGSPVSSVPGLRQTPGNGTLYFPPFSGQYFRADVHENVYRCKASNQAGTILSRDVHITAVVRQPYDIRVEGTEVFLGNVAFLRCFIPEHVRKYVTVTSWFRGDEELLAELAYMGRYFVTSGSGDLYIRTVQADDGLKKFSCQTIHKISRERKISDTVYLSTKEINVNMAPTTNQKPVIDMYVDRGNDIHLPCNIQGNPLPSYTWYRISDSNALYPVPSSQRIIPSNTLLYVRNADERSAGKWVCKATNQFGEQRVEIRLHVNVFLSVHVHPQVQIVNSGGTAIFNCSITGAGDEKIDWFHNGALLLPDSPPHDKIKLLTPTSLAVYNVGRSDRGMYQCLVTNKGSSAQAMAELKLGEITPEIIATFSDQIVRPDQFISFKCAATGSPPPQFIWQLDGQPITKIYRYAIGQYVDTNGDVITHLNITHVQTEDGGLYKCIASNSMGNVEYAARLNVYGSPYVRDIGPIKAVAGESFIMHCPFYGYPIETIRWEKSGQELVSSSKYELASVQSGGYLKIHQIDSARDSGMYTCIVRSRGGDDARREIKLNVNSPPVIEPPFLFPKNLQEGGRAQVTCAVSSGDMPVVFSWKKDEHQIPMNLQILVKNDEFFSMLVFKDISAKHSGRYTCYASNSAATVNYTSELLVKVPPRWIQEPQDIALMLGNAIVINCEAEGYPEPEITWFKGEGKSSKEFKSIQLRNSSLTVDLATDADEGYYMCTASNGIGVLKKILYINVNEPARFESASRNVSTRRNDPISLNCLAKGDDQISIIWWHNNNRVDLNNYRISITEMQTPNGINSTLSIAYSDRQDSGVYKCVAENAFGKSEYIMYVAVQERPDVPSNLECRDVSSRSVKLSWRRPFDGNSPVLSYVVQYQSIKFLHAHTTILNSENNWNSSTTINITLPNISVGKSSLGNRMEAATLAGLRPSTTYLIRMVAVNEIESSGFTETIIVRTLEEAPSEPPQNVQVQTGGIGELIVTWQLPPRDSWNGELIGYTINCTEEKQNINYISSNASLRRSIQVDGFATTKTTIKNLRTFRRYSIVIRAINSFGVGPFSAAVYATTLEGVPEMPPQNLNCVPLTSQSIKISWLEPPSQYHGGVIQGYKILYSPLGHSDDDIQITNEIKRTSNLETYLHALHKATNYSVRVLAYTSSGDGESTQPIYCSTEDDVPDAPAGIKAAALTGDSILVSWLPPKHRNGLILHYTVYTREAGKKGQSQSHMVRVDENGNPRLYESRGLIENQTYDYWVTASTSAGEGEPTSIATQTTTTKAPARIASFSQFIRKSIGSSLILDCNALGNPTPRARWFTRDRPVTFSPFYEIMTNGNLKIHSVEASLSGNFTCSAKNLFGEDNIVYSVIAMKAPNPPQINVHYFTSDSIRISWDNGDDGGAPILLYTISYRTTNGAWTKVELTPENTAYTIVGLKCGTQFILKMTATNRVGEGQPTDELIVWTKGKKSQEPDEQDFIITNSSCINLQFALWNDGGCPISHFSIEHRPHGEIRWTVLSSDIANSDENRNNLIFCDFRPATWYQLKVSATNDAGRTTAHYNIATTKLNGDRIPVPEVFPLNDITNDIAEISEQGDWLPTTIIGIAILSTSLIICITLRHRGILCGPISEGYESRTIPNDLKDEHESRRNQQVYSASPVKTVDKHNDSEMYEISPYATFSVSGGRTTSGMSKTPTRGVTPSTLDYTVQFKTFGHPDGDNLNATAYPVLPSAAFGHVKGKSSWQNQRYYNTDDDLTLSKSMTIVASSSQLQSHRNKNKRDMDVNRSNRSKSRNEITKSHHNDSESDTSGSPVNEFSNMSTYRVPTKSRGDIFRPDSSTESNNDNSPIDRRSNTPRHIAADMRMRPRPTKSPRESQSMDILRSGSNNSMNSEVNIEVGLRCRPPSGFTDSREFSEAECDREVQRVMENNNGQKITERDELTSLLARYHEKKERERLEYTIHV